MRGARETQEAHGSRQSRAAASEAEGVYLNPAIPGRQKLYAVAHHSLHRDKQRRASNKRPAVYTLACVWLL